MRSFIRQAIIPALLLPALASAFNPISLAPGWNLVGNSDGASIDVIGKFVDPKILTVWKWNQAAGKWAFFTPSMSPTVLTTYAQTKGYDVLMSLDSKEGFWVNANAAIVIADPLAPPPGTGSVQLTVSDLAQGWNLVASADKKTPSQLNSTLASSLNAASKGIATVWAWDGPSSSWRFYAPSLEAQGGNVLGSYISSKNYLPFSAPLTVTDGFWVNIGAATSTPPAPGAGLRFFSFFSPSDWSLRVLTSTARQNTPDANGKVRYSERRTARSGNGIPYNWGPGSGPARGADLHWNGSVWRTCPINFENSQTPYDAAGTNSYDYCDGVETGSSLREAAVDIAARPMIDVYNEIIAAGKTNLTISNASAVLGSATFPVGSLRYYQSSTPATEGVDYYPGTGNRVFQTNADVAAGKALATNVTAACALITGSTPQTSYASLNATLEGLIAVNKGTPCVFSENIVNGISSGPRNEWWGNSLLSLGTIGSAPPVGTPTTSYYTGNTWLGVGFGSGNVANYYSCQQRYNGGNARNCDKIGAGNYAIQTLVDGRTLSFSGLPAAVSPLGYERVFVERSGFVYYGFRSMPLVIDTARLNLTGLNALFAQLGLPAVDPGAPVTLGVPSYGGTYSGTISGSDTGTFLTSFNATGTQLCSGNLSSTGAFACTFTLTPNAADTTTASLSIAITGSAATLTGQVDFYTGAVSGTWVNGAASGSFAGARQ